MKIVFVGPDCAGKSTIADAVAKELNMPIINNGRLKDRLDMLSKVLYELADVEYNVILDRWQFPDDIIYEEVCSGEISPLRFILPNLVQRFNAYDNLMVYVTANNKTLVERYNYRGDELRSLDEILRASAAYEEFFVLSGVEHIKIDTSNLSTDVAIGATVCQVKAHVHRVVEKLKREEELKEKKLPKLKEDM